MESCRRVCLLFGSDSNTCSKLCPMLSSLIGRDIQIEWTFCSRYLDPQFSGEKKMENLVKIGHFWSKCQWFTTKLTETQSSAKQLKMNAKFTHSEKFWNSHVKFTSWMDPKTLRIWKSLRQPCGYEKIKCRILAKLAMLINKWILLLTWPICSYFEIM